MMPEGTILTSTEDAGESKEKVSPEKKVEILPKLTSVPWPAVVVISVLISILSVFFYDRFYAQKIIAVDMKGYIAKQRDLYMEGKLTDEQFRANVDKLEEAIKSIPSNRVAIMGDVVLKNAEQKQLP